MRANSSHWAPRKGLSMSRSAWVRRPLVGVLVGTVVIAAVGTSHAGAHSPHPGLVQVGNCKVDLRQPSLAYYSGYYSVGGKAKVQGGCGNDRITVGHATHVPGRGWNSICCGAAYGGPPPDFFMFGQYQSFFCPSQGSSRNSYATGVHIAGGAWHRDDGAVTPIC